MSFCVRLPLDAGIEPWRAAARRLLAAGIPPQQVLFVAEGQEADLFGAAPLPAPEGPVGAIPRAFAELAEHAAQHRDPERFALLYRVLWRLQRERALLADASDRDVARLERLARAVKRDAHKMHAFVRFRETADPDGERRFVAWYEPDHYILEAEAGFFVRRFASQRWSILTPRKSAIWDGEALHFGPGASKADAPPEDAHEEDWRTYYESIFNPARLKLEAMRAEMPKKRWANLPEAESIQKLIREAPARVEAMQAAQPALPRKRPSPPPEPKPAMLSPLAAEMQACTRCPLYANATQAVPGEGACGARLALVGEQPGDQEDLAGKPFIGPAGQVLDQALAAAGLAREETFVTNAVKHFKHEPRGKRRIHVKPNSAEIEACRWWLDQELEAVSPRVIVGLGATALESLAGYTKALKHVRGQVIEGRAGRLVFATVHPSYLLRLTDEAAKAEEFERFVKDLRAAAAL